MTIIVKKTALKEHLPPKSTTPLNLPYAEALSNLTVECHIRIGTARLTVKELQQLESNTPLILEQKIHESVDVLLNNQVIARGNLVCVDENFAVEITEVSA